ncbi:MAG TPA: biopolymer transporter ExbD [Gemmatimonadaceae bacterium]|nr:biopolymer transporter ExbD [Gemmatimonadaceae bacterium]
MGMSAGGGKGGFTSEPNLTPMIDVLLVLLIIFMVIIPMGRKAFDVQLPDPTAPPPPKNQKTDQIVLEVNPGEQFLINKAPISKSELFQKLKDIYDPRPTKVLFIKGDPEVVYQDVIFAMDQARGAGVKVIGATPPPATGGK